MRMPQTAKFDKNAELRIVRAEGWSAACKYFCPYSGQDI